LAIGDTGAMINLPPQRDSKLRISQMGQSRRFDRPLTTSGLPPTADITHQGHHFRKVPILLQKYFSGEARKF
jgi:hypothetical protein